MIALALLIGIALAVLIGVSITPRRFRLRGAETGKASGEES
ncbi:MAG: hypothetical protein WAL25_09305 [Acidimicrobiia bacterium]